MNLPSYREVCSTRDLHHWIDDGDRPVRNTKAALRVEEILAKLGAVGKVSRGSVQALDFTERGPGYITVVDPQSTSEGSAGEMPLKMSCY